MRQPRCSHQATHQAAAASKGFGDNRIAMAPKKDTGKKDMGKLPASGSDSHRGGTPSHRGSTPSHRGNSPSKKEKSSRGKVKKKGKSALNAVSEGALEDDGDDTNLDDIDDDDDAVRRTPLPPKLHRALTELDKIVIRVLLCGAIRLLCVEWLLMQPDNFKMPNRQALEALEKSGASPSPLLSREAAAALVRRCSGLHGERALRPLHRSAVAMARPRSFQSPRALGDSAS